MGSRFKLPVSLGPNIRLLVAYLTTIQGLTYQQVTQLLADLYQFPITDREIEYILAGQRAVLLPIYEQLKTGIRAGPAAHDVVFRLSDNRGNGNAQALWGEQHNHVGVTDRYGGYKHIFGVGKHRVCWAHLQRNA